jgi:hypothetical protein
MFLVPPKLEYANLRGLLFIMYPSTVLSGCSESLLDLHCVVCDELICLLIYSYDCVIKITSDENSSRHSCSSPMHVSSLVVHHSFVQKAWLVLWRLTCSSIHQSCVPNGGTVFCSSIDEHQRHRPQS